MDRDYRKPYRSGEVDPRDADVYDAPRRRIPTALDPYLYPEDRDELKRNIAEVKARNAKYHLDEYRDYDPPARREVSRDDISTSTIKEAARAGTTKTTYSVTPAGLEKESETKSRIPTTARLPVPTDAAPSVSRPDRRGRDEYEAARSTVRGSARPYGDREPVRTERLYDPERRIW